MAMTRGQHLIGTILGSCVLERLIGYGGSSAVFLGQQHTPNRKVAVKVFLPRSTMDAQSRREFYRRFLREAEAASHLNHPNILPIYSYGEQDGLPYIIMPYMSGGTLSEYMTQHGPLSLEEAQWHLEQLASALDYAHQNGCIHCDVKPANILLDGERRIMLADFGIAHLMPDSELEAQETVTKSPESLMGTPDYISPEQALGHSLDGRSDVYSLGIVLFYLLSKQLPFKADSTLTLALMHIHEVPPSLYSVRADITPAINRVVRKSLAKKPEQRFQTAQAFSTAFTKAINSAEDNTIVDPFGNKEPSPSPAKAEVQVKSFALNAPTVSRVLTTPRVLIVAALLLLIVGGTIMSTVYLSHRLPVGATGVQTSFVHGAKQTNPDTLENDDYWPLSSTFFYDQQHHYYHIVNKSAQTSALALYNQHQYADFRLSVTTRFMHGVHDASDYYGIVFRASADQSRYYLLEMMSSVTGQYIFWRFDGKWQTLASGSISSLAIGSQKNNTLTIDAQGSSFSFLVNDKPLGPRIYDSSSPLTTGEVGLYVEQQNAEVAFSHLYITTPKS